MNTDKKDKDGNSTNSSNGLLIGIGVAAVGAAAVALSYWNSGGSGSSSETDSKNRRQQPRQQNTSQRKPATASSAANMAQQGPKKSGLASAGIPDISKINIGGTGSGKCKRGVSKKSVPESPEINNLNALLSDIYVRYIALNDEEFEEYYKVFDEIFKQIHKKMKEVDPYYKNYSSTQQFAGSHSDRLRIDKADEFDMDILIDLPLSTKVHPLDPSQSDYVFELQDPGFVQLKMGVQFQNLYKRDKQHCLIYHTPFEWKDDKNYLLRSKFMDWFKSVVTKALNEFKTGQNTLPVLYAHGVAYTVDRSQSGPAETLYIKNNSRKFQLDVDLVPALRFPEERWPVSRDYERIPSGCEAPQKVWLLVPKPNKGQPATETRSWRIALHDQERKMMHDLKNLKQAIRLLKKLRDSQDMKKVASYYLKTLFFWEIKKQNSKAFWNQNPAALFKIMVKEFHDALVAGSIPYFWNKKNNLLGSVDKGILKGYAAKLTGLIDILADDAQYKMVAKYLLTKDEYKEYNAKFLHI